MTTHRHPHLMVTPRTTTHTYQPYHSTTPPSHTPHPTTAQQPVITRPLITHSCKRREISFTLTSEESKQSNAKHRQNNNIFNSTWPSLITAHHLTSIPPTCDDQAINGPFKRRRRNSISITCKCSIFPIRCIHIFRGPVISPVWSGCTEGLWKLWW